MFQQLTMTKILKRSLHQILCQNLTKFDIVD